MALRIHNITNTFKSDIFIRCATTKSSTYDYQHLQRSKIPTMHFQKSLPRLPIPKLEDTCNRYLAAQRPILTPEQFTQTERVTRNFQQNEGKTLDSLLVRKDKQNKHTSYISEPWFDMYLRDRTPLPINYNPVIIFENDIKPNYNTQLLKATNMLISSLRFIKSLRANILEPEVFHINPKKSDTALFRRVCSLLPSRLSWYGAYLMNAYPLDMSQYGQLFNSTRVPMVGKDKLFQDCSARHILVMRGGQFYKVEVLDEHDQILPATVLLTRLKNILDERCAEGEVPLGAMTTEHRDCWAEVRQHMVARHQENARFFEQVDSALFALVLDDDQMGDDKLKMIRHYLHADGKNRWFDKSFSLIVTKDGTAGLNFEHSWGDGVAVLRYFQDIYHDSINNPHVHPDTEPVSGTDTQVQKLSFKIDDVVQTAVKNALNKYKSVVDSLDVNFFITDGIGRKICKKHNISPDSLMQLGFQNAFYKQNKQFVASYESCSTAAFKHGRTETIRPCTMATKQYCETAEKCPDVDLLPLIIQCSNVHKTLTKEAAMGQGFDRHLFALKLTAAEHDMPTPQIYQDPAYSLINNNILSTSTLSSPAIQGGGFGPVVPDGYGIGYMIREDQLGTVVTNYRAHRDGAHFVQQVNRSFKQLRDILTKPL